MIPLRTSVEASKVALRGLVLTAMRYVAFGKNGSLPSFGPVGTVKTERGISASGAAAFAGDAGLGGGAETAEQSNAIPREQATQILNPTAEYQTKQPEPRNTLNTRKSDAAEMFSSACFVYSAVATPDWTFGFRTSDFGLRISS